MQRLLLSERLPWSCRTPDALFFAPLRTSKERFFDVRFKGQFAFQKQRIGMLIFSTPNMLCPGFLPLIEIEPYFQQYGNDAFGQNQWSKKERIVSMVVITANTRCSHHHFAAFLTAFLINSDRLSPFSIAASVTMSRSCSDR